MDFFGPFTSTTPATVTLGVAPDHAAKVVRQAIRSAQHSIEIEAYTLQSYGIVNDIVNKMRNGVSVTVLLEGGPVGGLEYQTLWACQQIENAGGQCWFMHSDTDLRIYARYDYIHAKFIILDRQRLLVSTQNFNDGGMPTDDKSDGTYGSRGYVLYIESPELAARAAQIFERDRDTVHSDIVPWGAYQYVAPPPSFVPVTTSGGTTSTVYFAAPQTFTDATRFELFTAPEAALRQSDTLLGLVARAGAGDQVLVEQMYEYSEWGGAPNPRLQAYIDAARRKAQVRLLLNSGYFDAEYIDLTKSITTVQYINTLAQQAGLDLQARLGNPTQYGIHSKIVLVRLGYGDRETRRQGDKVTERQSNASNFQSPTSNIYYSHVGSINGSEASSKVNRELAVQVESAGLHAALERVFWSDWHLSAPTFLPLVARNYTPPAPPVNYVVVSEVLYDPYGSDTGAEWVELYNPTDHTIDISGWSLGDAVTDGEYGSGRYSFPPNTSLQPGQVIVIAQQAADVAPLAPDFEFLIDSHRDYVTVTNMIPAPQWDGFGFALGNAGDEVILRDAASNLVDALVWGTGNAAALGVLPHPGVAASAHSLERRPAMYDTNDCSHDFVDRYPPEPGKISNTLGPVVVSKRAR
jgi:phosphatidylserine/phosphatidylglycerophosphate/cardiolipin synthase-like enzyme